MYQPPGHIGSSHVPGVILHNALPIPVDITMTGGGNTFIAKDEAQITWLLTSSTQAQILHGGEVLKKSTQFSDYYGYLTSIESGVQEVHSLMKRYNITPESTAVVELLITLEATPYLQKQSDIEHNLAALTNGKKMKLVSVQSCQLRVPLMEQKDIPAEDQFPSRSLEAIHIKTIPVFNSQHTDELNEGAMKDLRGIIESEGPRDASARIKSLFDAKLKGFMQADDLHSLTIGA